MRVQAVTDDAYDEGEISLYKMPVYTKINVPGRLPRTLYVYGPSGDPSNVYSVVFELCNDEHSGQDGYVANYAKFGVEEVLDKPQEYEYELPPHYSPTDVHFVKVRIMRLDDDVQGVHGQRVVTFPYMGPDYLTGIYFSVGHMLVKCKDGFYRYCNDFEVISVETYKV